MIEIIIPNVLSNLEYGTPFCNAFFNASILDNSLKNVNRKNEEYYWKY